MTGGTVGARLAEVEARIDAACAACGRDRSEVRLVAVSKTHAPELVREAYAAGQRWFGESYAQELATKAEALADLEGIVWHFIGHLQSNKAKVVARHAHVVHAVDSPAIAHELGRRVVAAGREALPVLLEVNVSREPQKHGVPPQELEELMTAVRAEAGLVLRGLMTMPPFGDPAAARQVFGTLASLRSLHGGAAALPELSMGMSDDLEIAIACGATLVRVGTAIFGEREKA